MTLNKDGFWFTIAEGFQFLHRGRKSTGAGAAIPIVVASSCGPVRRKTDSSGESFRSRRGFQRPALSDFCQQSPLSEDSKFSHSATSCRLSLQDINIPDSNPFTLPKLSSEPQPLRAPQLRWGPCGLGCVDTSDSHTQGRDYLGGNSTNEKLLHLLSQQ